MNADMEIVRINPMIGMASLVGTGIPRYPDKPIFGNYFGFIHPSIQHIALAKIFKKQLYRELFCLNMWEENLVVILEHIPIKDLEIISINDNAALVIDRRIPKEWINKEVCRYGAPISTHLNFYDDVEKLNKEYLLAWI